MQQLDALAAEARTLAIGVPPLGPSEAEVARQMQICNACRYCEGFCAVFPAMTRRLEFGKADIHYLANLCHNCGACLHACQYAPPHEFAVNVPQAMAKVRVQTYADYAWPPALGGLYQRNGLTLALALAAGGLALFLLLAIALNGSLWHEPLAGNFYQVFPHNLMVSMFAPIFLFALLALALGVRRFWNDVSPGDRVKDAPRAAAAEATRDALRLKYLDGGHGEGLQRGRRRLHAVAPPLPSLHLLRLHAVLRRDLRRHALPLSFRLACAVCLDQPAGAARHGGRHRLADRAGRAAVAEPAAAIRCTAMRRRSRWTAASSRCCSSPA